MLTFPVEVETNGIPVGGNRRCQEEGPEPRAPADYYTARPTGGHPRYTYRREWCSCDCIGDALRRKGGAGGGVHPNAPPAGWQSFGNTQAVVWAVRNRTFRVTVTDSRSAEAEAEHTAPP